MWGNGYYIYPNKNIMDFYGECYNSLCWLLRVHTNKKKCYGSCYDSLWFLLRLIIVLVMMCHGDHKMP